MARSCRKCDDPLEVGVNWYPSSKKAGAYICKSCLANGVAITRKANGNYNVKEVTRIFTDTPRESIQKLTEARRGRPRALEPDDITLTLVASLAMIQCTDNEYAAALSCSLPTWMSFKQEFPEVQQVMDTNRGNGRISLRRKTWDMAMDGNWNALQHLNKHVLGEHDKTTQDVNVNVRRTALDMDTIDGEVIETASIGHTRLITDDPDED